MALLCRARTFSRHAAFALIYASLTAAVPSPIPSTLTISFPPQPATGLAQTWPTATSDGGDASLWTGSGSGSTGGDASQWSSAGGGDASQWTGAGGGDASQWTGAGGGGYDFTSLFTIDLEAIRIAHACLAISAMLVFFPFGGVIIRLVGHRHIAWFHAGVQMFAYTVFLAAAGLGIWMATNYKVVDGYHPILGMIILFLLSLQPITEILNHFLFNRYPKAIYLAHFHIWAGRVAITLGMINGGLGFAFADTIPYQPVWSVAPKIAYAIIAGLVWIAYFAYCGVVQQVRSVRKMSADAGVGEGEEMENLRGRVIGVGGLEEGTGNASRITVGDAQKRTVGPGFRSSAL